MGPPTLEVVPMVAARGESPAPKVAVPEVAVGDRPPAPEVEPKAEEETVVVVGATAPSPVHESAASEPTTTSGPTAGATSSGPRAAAAVDTAAVVVEEPEVVLGHPLLVVSGEVSLDEAVGTGRWALYQAQDMLCQERGDATDECRHLQLGATMLREMTLSEKAVV
jgi:hypothetical protein